MEQDTQKAVTEALKRKVPLFRAIVSVTVWLDGDPRRDAKVVEVELDEAFSYARLGHAGDALQRGAYMALEEAAESLLASSVDVKPDV